MRPGLAALVAALVPIVVVVALPLALLVVNGAWAYDSTHWFDTNIYLGYFRHFLEHTYPYDANYKASRLPFVLAGVALYRALPPVVAHHALFLAFHTLTTASVFVVARRFFGATAALVAACALATSTTAHLCPGYHDQAAAGLFWCSLAASGPTPRRAAIAGGFAALALTTDAIIAVLGPAWLLVTLASTPPSSSRVRLLAAAIAGAVVALALAGAVSVACGGPFLFFVRQLVIATALTGHHFAHEGAFGALAHVVDAPHLVMPLVAAVLGLPALVRAVRARRLDGTSASLGGLWATLLLACALQQRGDAVLEQSHLFLPLFGTAFLALVALFAEVRARRADVVVVTLAFLVPLVLFGSLLERFVTAAHAVAIAVAAALIVGAWLLRSRAHAAWIAALALGVANPLVADRSQGAHLYAFDGRCSFRADAFDAVLRADPLWSAFDPSRRALPVVATGPLAPDDLEAPAAPRFDGTWCHALPRYTAVQALVLPDFFYDDDQWLSILRTGTVSRDLPDKLAAVGVDDAALDAEIERVRGTFPAGTTFTLRFANRIEEPTFSAVLRGYDVTPP